MALLKGFEASWAFCRKAALWTCVKVQLCRQPRLHPEMKMVQAREREGGKDQAGMQASPHIHEKETEGEPWRQKVQGALEDG